MVAVVAGRGAVRVMALLAALAACGARDHHKRAEMSPLPFVLGSRYGRSPERLITPRNDRFFMGGRYGKRSQPPATQQAPGPRPPGMGARETDRGPLYCEYTGVLRLYRCASKRDSTHARPFYQRNNGDPASAHTVQQ